MKIIRNIWVLPLLLVIGCSTGIRIPSQEKDLQQRLIDQVSKRSPIEEYEKRLNQDTLAFLAVGSNFYGLSFPGLSKDELSEYVESEKFPIELEYIDDPAPAFATEEYWIAVESFLTQYNKLVVGFVREGQSKRSDRKSVNP